jgi:hypothetical protein
MNLAPTKLLDRGFPFRIAQADRLGNPIQTWNGTTFFNGDPSGSASSFVPVVGPGTTRPLGYTLAALADFYYRLAVVQASCAITHLIDATETAPESSQSRMRIESELSITNIRPDAPFPPTAGQAAALQELALLPPQLGNRNFLPSPTSDAESTESTVTVDEVRFWESGDWGEWQQSSDVYGGDPVPYPYFLAPLLANDFKLEGKITSAADLTPSNLPDVLKSGDAYYPILVIEIGGMLNSVRKQRDYNFFDEEPSPILLPDRVADVACQFLGRAVTLYEFQSLTYEYDAIWSYGDYAVNENSLTGTATIESLHRWQWPTPP